MNEQKVYLGTFKRAESKNGATYYWGSFGGARAVMFETKTGDGLNLYVSERPPKDNNDGQQADKAAQSALDADPIPF